MKAALGMMSTMSKLEGYDVGRLFPLPQPERDDSELQAQVDQELGQ